MRTLLLISFTALLFASNLHAEQLRNDAALQGLTHANVVFDINVGKAELLLLRLKLVDETYRDLQEFGVKPKFVLAFRGKASRFLTVNEEDVAPADRAMRNEIEKWIGQFSSEGMALEQCAIAARLLNIDNRTFLPQLKVVANGYISIIGYQGQGYSFVPMD